MTILPLWRDTAELASTFLTLVLISTPFFVERGELKEGEQPRRHPLVRAFRWWLAPLVDKWDGLSLNRFIAIIITLATSHKPLFHEGDVTAADNCAFVIAGSLAWGKDMWLAYIERSKTLAEKPNDAG
jgi:hypothetical protein